MTINGTLASPGKGSIRTCLVRLVISAGENSRYGKGWPRPSRVFSLMLCGAQYSLWKTAPDNRNTRVSKCGPVIVPHRNQKPFGSCLWGKMVTDLKGFSFTSASGFSTAFVKNSFRMEGRIFIHAVRSNRPSHFPTHNSQHHNFHHLSTQFYF